MVVSESASRLSELRASPTSQPDAGGERIVEVGKELFEVVLSTLRTYAPANGHFDNPAREYLSYEQPPGFRIKCHARRRDQAIGDYRKRPAG